ncbi:gcy-36, partial [Symbiodinium sp. KB8]
MSVHASGVNYDYDRVIRVPLLLSCCPDARQKDGLRRVILPEGEPVGILRVLSKTKHLLSAVTELGMHGLIHVFFRRFVIQTAGEEIWKKILDKVISADREQVFLALTAHPDGLTFAALDTFCALVKQPLPVVLERFGGFFVQHVAEEGYLTFLKSLGGNLFQFLSNINILHHTIERDSKAAVFPLFSVKHLDGDPKSEHHVFLLTYGSMRPGLTPFLTGVLTKAAFLLFTCTVDIQDVTDSFPPEMGKDVLVQSSFRVTASRVSGFSTSETQPKRGDEFTSTRSFFDFHKMLSAMWRCDCTGGSQEGFNLTQLDRVPVQDMEPEVWAVIMEKQDKIDEILRAYDGIDAGVNVVPRMTGGDRMRLAAVLFRGIAAGSVSASWTEAARLQDMGEFWATNSVSFGDKFRESKDWFTNGQESIVAARRTHGEILFVSHCWSAPREWGMATAGKSPYGQAKAAELCLHAKQVADSFQSGDKDWKKVGFWIDKACIPQSDPGLMSWCVNLLEEFIALSDGMVVLASWNYFNRLWCVYEWVCGLLIHDVMEIEILADPFVRDSTVDLYLECIRNFSIARCECAVESDRQILIDKVNTYYKSVEDFERFFQFTVIACFIRCMARRRTARAGASLMPWIDLATACGFAELADK